MRIQILKCLLSILAVVFTNGCAAIPSVPVGRDGAEMVLVPAGPFVMGTGEGEVEASPPHQVELAAYYIDRCEVTNAQYARFVAATGAAAPLNWGGQKPPAGAENLPVTEVENMERPAP